MITNRGTVKKGIFSFQMSLTFCGGRRGNRIFLNTRIFQAFLMALIRIKLGRNLIKKTNHITNIRQAQLKETWRCNERTTRKR